MNNPNLKKFYQNSPKPVNYLPNFLVDGSPQYAPTMSGLMLINPTTKDIWVSAGKEFVSDWINIVGGGGGGVTSIIAGTNISITSTGPGGTGAVTINSSGGGPQGLQDVIIEDNVLTQNNLILGTNTSIEWNGNNYFEINPTVSYPGGPGYFRAGVGKFPPSYCELYVEALYAQMVAQGATSQIVKVDPIGVYVQTPAVAGGSAIPGQALTLADPFTGQVEFTWPSTRTYMEIAQLNIPINSSDEFFNDLFFTANGGKSYSFRAVISYTVDTPNVLNAGVAFGLYGAVVADFTTYYCQVWANSGLATWQGQKVDRTITTNSPTFPLTSLTVNEPQIAIVEGVISNVISAAKLTLVALAKYNPFGPGPIGPNDSIIVHPGSTLTVHELP